MAMTDHLVTVLMVGAARADATPEQVEALRERVLPVMKDPGRPYSDVHAALHEVMGPGWQPTGDWARQIEALAAE